MTQQTLLRTIKRELRLRLQRQLAAINTIDDLLASDLVEMSDRDMAQSFIATMIDPDVDYESDKATDELLLTVLTPAQLDKLNSLDS